MSRPRGALCSLAFANRKGEGEEEGEPGRRVCAALDGEEFFTS